MSPKLEPEARDQRIGCTSYGMSPASIATMDRSSAPCDEYTRTPAPAA
jgi:hypothetical protein